jgi:hypothetical protein
MPSEGNHKVWILVTWDEGMPMVRHYEDGQEAAEIYRDAARIRDAAYLYSADESGHMDLILETERIPGGR